MYTCKTEHLAEFAKIYVCTWIWCYCILHATPLPPPSFLCSNACLSFDTSDTSSTVTESCKILENSAIYKLALNPLKGGGREAQRTVYISDQIMSADNYMCIFLRQIEANTYLLHLSYKLMTSYRLTGSTIQQNMVENPCC